MRRSAFNKGQIEQELAVSQRKDARKKNAAATANVLRHIQDVDRKVERLRKKNLADKPKKAADELHKQAQKEIIGAEKFCDAHKRTALVAGDAREDCRRSRRAARGKARVLHAEAAELLTQHEAQAAAGLAKAEREGRDKLLALLATQKDTQEMKRLLRGKKKSSISRAQSGERRAESRQVNIDNFPAEHREFCRENYGEVARRAKSGRVEMHEACAEMAQEDEFANQAAYLGASRAFEGKSFDRKLAKEMAKAYGVTAEKPARARKKRAEEPKPKFADDIPF